MLSNIHSLRVKFAHTFKKSSVGVAVFLRGTAASQKIRWILGGSEETLSYTVHILATNSRNYALLAETCVYSFLRMHKGSNFVIHVDPGLQEYQVAGQVDYGKYSDLLRQQKNNNMAIEGILSSFRPGEDTTAGPMGLAREKARTYQKELANKINRIKLLNISQKLFKSCTDFSIIAFNASNFDDHF